MFYFFSKWGVVDYGYKERKITKEKVETERKRSGEFF